MNLNTQGAVFDLLCPYDKTRWPYIVRNNEMVKKLSFGTGPSEIAWEFTKRGLPLRQMTKAYVGKDELQWYPNVLDLRLANDTTYVHGFKLPKTLKSIYFYPHDTQVLENITQLHVLESIDAYVLESINNEDSCSMLLSLKASKLRLPTVLREFHITNNSYVTFLELSTLCCVSQYFLDNVYNFSSLRFLSWVVVGDMVDAVLDVSPLRKNTLLEKLKIKTEPNTEILGLDTLQLKQLDVNGNVYLDSLPATMIELSIGPRVTVNPVHKPLINLKVFTLSKPTKQLLDMCINANIEAVSITGDDEITPDISICTNIKKLCLLRYNITKIGTFKSLTCLNLSRVTTSNMKSFVTSISKLKNLETCEIHLLNEGAIDVSEMAENVMLVSLKLEASRSLFVHGLGKLDQLKSLCVDGTSLCSIPRMIESLTIANSNVMCKSEDMRKLERLCIHYKNLPKNWFEALAKNAPISAITIFKGHVYDLLELKYSRTLRSLTSDATRYKGSPNYLMVKDLSVIHDLKYIELSFDSWNGIGESEWRDIFKDNIGLEVKIGSRSSFFIGL